MDAMLPTEKPKEYKYLWNKGTQTYDVLDLSSGKLVRKQDLQVSVSTFYTEEAAAAIIDRVLSGDSLIKISRDPNFPSYSTILGWCAAFPEFKRRINEARIHRGEVFYDRALELADIAPTAPKDSIPGIKLAIDTYKWAAEKNDPERFAKVKEATVQSGPGVTIVIDTGIHKTQVPDDVYLDDMGNVHVKGDKHEVQDDGERGREVGLELNLTEQVRFRELDDAEFREIEGGGEASGSSEEKKAIY